MHPMTEAEYYLPSASATPEASLWILVLFGGILLLGLLGLFAARYLRHRRRAAHYREAAKQANAPLKPGPTVVAGTVADEGEGPAVTIDIDQTGSQRRYKGSWVHRWSEQGRVVHVRPFYLSRPSGERVRVEPDERVFLVDKLDGLTVLGPARRRRSATLIAGESAYVVGVMTSGFDPLKGGYRDNGSALVLRPSGVEPMLISTEPLADRHTRAASLYRTLALSTLLMLALIHGGLFLRDHAVRFFWPRRSSEGRVDDDLEGVVQAKAWPWILGLLLCCAAIHGRPSILPGADFLPVLQ
jgi:hypothetical protein